MAGQCKCAVLLNSVTADGSGEPFNALGLDDFLFTIVGTGSANATVKLEYQDPTGAWQSLHESSAFTGTANVEPVQAVDFPVNAVRATIADYVGGTFTVYVQAR